MKLKTFITTMLAVTLIFTLSACSKNQSVDESDKPDADTQKTEQNMDEGTTVDDDTTTTDTADADKNNQDESWKKAFEKSLLENYNVVPESYEDLGNGIYQVYVKIDGKTVPYVTVDSATGEYHG
ncbi:MAG: hypothetical protein PUE18_10470 [Firmicutes bacterium]|nr:hypothetical protein [Bacillota bacterium]